MGDLIVLPRSTPSERLFVEGQSAEILFFTGVRYYRMEDTPAPIKRRRRSRRAADAVQRVELRG